ncbi:MAG TPA: SDR family NAD(P)-dependent oxidoreductase [Actinomycetota bacterium]|jgi:NAD(P)-dependent dehydrogenase (short-subunit alcohol dehydrogenase family)|nr:SDR family NAD(P)-dependent oxidoreductase [Actinomycetota bacterium]
MKDLAGKTAVITGGGSGIGRGTALALADAGMNVVIADIDEAAAKTVADEVVSRGRAALVVPTDVTDRASVEALADAAWSEFGAVHVLHNNAGVFIFMRLDSMSDADWRWLLSINLEGVINGLQVFLPRLKELDGERHIVNTASMAGMLAGQYLGAYNATKFAVVAISETLHAELANEGIGVSVLCPGGVNTNIFQHALDLRPSGGRPMEWPEQLNEQRTTSLRMIDPEDVGRMVRRGIECNDLYIFTHPEFEALFRARADRILAAFERAGRTD